MSIAGWAVLDQFIIQKGLGHYEWDALINGLLGMAREDGSYGGMPRADDDIGGGYMVGVEADAMWEALYEGQRAGVSQQDYDIIMSGPQGPYGEEAYVAATRRAIQAGSQRINQAIEITNQKKMEKWTEKYNQALSQGKAPPQQPTPIPLAFSADGHLTDEWRNGVAGRMDKNQPFQFLDPTGQTYALRTINRDQHNKSPESWARPYSEGLKELRGGKSTRDYIESHRLHPNSVYIDNEGHKAIIDMMDHYAAMGQPITTPEQFKAAWVQHGTLRNKMPHFGAAPLDMGNGNLQPIHNPHLYGIREREEQQAPPDIAEQDQAEAMVDAQQTPPDPNEGLNWLIDSGLAINPKNNRSWLGNYTRDDRHRHGGGWSNQAGQRGIYNNFMAHEEYGAKIPEDQRPSFEDVLAMNPGRAHGMWKLAQGLMQLHRGEGQTPAAPQPEEPLFTEYPPQEQPLPPVQPPIQQEQAPPVPQREPEPPVPQRQQLPNQIPPRIPPMPQQPQIPPQLPPQDLNANQVQSPPLQQSGEELPPNRRGLMERLGYALGAGAGKIANIFTREEVEDALESVQMQMALQNDAVVKMLPHVSMNPNKATDIAFVAGSIQRPASDVVAILNSKGDWREMSKSMDVPLDVIQLVKVVFK